MIKLVVSTMLIVPLANYWLLLLDNDSMKQFRFCGQTFKHDHTLF